MDVSVPIEQPADSRDRGGSSADLPPRAGRGGMARLSPALRTVALGAHALDAVAPTLATRIMLRHFTVPRRRPDADYRAALPAGARSVALPYAGRQLAAWCWGEKGPSVLLVHGWEDHAGSMLGFVAPLRALGYRVYALDAPGHGLSPRMPTHLLDTSRALEWMSELHGPFDSIVAHSYGVAAVCLMLSRNARFEPRRLALVSPMQGLDQHLEVFADIALLTNDRAHRLRSLVARLIECPTEHVCALRAVQTLTVPGLVIHDRDDPVIPHAAGAAFARHWRGARFVSTAELGHRRILRCPAVLDEVLRFQDLA